jgi:hypothetical protein
MPHSISGSSRNICSCANTTCLQKNRLPRDRLRLGREPILQGVRLARRHDRLDGRSAVHVPVRLTPAVHSG